MNWAVGHICKTIRGLTSTETYIRASPRESSQPVKLSVYARGSLMYAPLEPVLWDWL